MLIEILVKQKNVYKITEIFMHYKFMIHKAYKKNKILITTPKMNILDKIAIIPSDFLSCL